ncbi:MAG: LptF/LptG family permease [Planctomycetes bacterium]|nr:LptF/LptG family permease [Planctomycetota bacterium]
MRRPAPRLVMARAHLREIGAQIILVLGATLVLVTLAAMVRASSDSQGAPLWMALSLLLPSIGNALPYLLPAALLTAVVLSYGRMAADGEATALRTAGVHPWRILRPALAIGLIVAALSYPLTAFLLPRLYSEMREVSYRLRFAALENTNPPSSELSFEGIQMSWGDRGPGGDFHDVLLVFRQAEAEALQLEPAGEAVGAGSPALRLRAERCQMSVVDRQLRLRLRGLRSLDEDPAALRWSGTGTTHLTLNLDRLGQRTESKAADFSSPEIRRQLASGEVKARKRLSFEVEWWRRIGLALTPVPLALIGALLGWRLRRSGVLSAFAAAFSVQLLLYYPVFYLGSSLAVSGTLSPAAGALLPVGGLAVILGVLLPQGRRA